MDSFVFQIDPLRREGKLLAECLEQAGVEVDYHSYEGVAHELLGLRPAQRARPPPEPVGTALKKELRHGISGKLAEALAE